MPGVRLNLPIELHPPAAPADAPDHVEAAPQAVPSAPAAKDAGEPLEDKAHGSSLTKKPKASK